MTGSNYDLKIKALLPIVSIGILLIVGSTVLFQLPVLLPAIAGIALILIYLITNNFEISYLHLTVFLIISSLLLPPISIKSTLPDIRFEEFIFYIFFPFILLKPPEHKKLKGRAKTFAYVFMAFLVCMFISLIWGVMHFGVPTGSRDFVNFFKIAKYLIIFWVIYRFNYTDDELKTILYVVLGTLFISVTLGFLQLYGVFGLDHITAPLFLQNRAYMATERLVGTFHNPNTYGSILLVGIIICLVLLFHKSLVKNRVLISALLVYFIAALILTVSRTDVAIFVFIAILIPVYNTYKHSINPLYVLLFFTGFVLLLIPLAGFLTYDILVRYISGMNILQDQSFLMRLYSWYINTKIFLQSPIVGWGTSEYLYTTIVDNEYILMLRNFGILGTSVYIWFYFLPLIEAWKSNATKDIHKAWNQIIMFSIISFLIVNLTNSTFSSIQTMDFLVVMIGIFFSIQNNKREGTGIVETST